MSIALFDVDGTLLPGPSLERRFMVRLLARRLLTWRHVGHAALSIAADIPWSTARFKANKAYLRGVAAAPLREEGRRFIDEAILPALRRDARAAIEQHRARGDSVLLLTGALDLLVEPLADRLGLDGWIAARLEERDGRFTGISVPPHPYGEGKQAALQHYAARHALDLRAASFYSDCHSDLPTLAQVGHAVVVNPDRRLARLARERGWEVVEWRNLS